MPQFSPWLGAVYRLTGRRKPLKMQAGPTISATFLTFGRRLNGSRKQAQIICSAMRD
jgi:hypothetical protein